ncbi:MAG: hypothetical protein WBV73_23040 [Phormidium sp.]
MLQRIHQFILIVSLAFVPAIALAQSGTPKANRNGDFTTDVPANIFHDYWVVVDSDPRGLNCRWSPQLPRREWDGANVIWPKANFEQWPVVRRFPKNTRLTAYHGPAGSTTIIDTLRSKDTEILQTERIWEEPKV